MEDNDPGTVLSRGGLLPGVLRVGVNTDKRDIGTLNHTGNPKRGPIWQWLALFDGPTIFPPVFPAKPDRLDAETSVQTRPKCPAERTMSRDTALPGLNERKKISLSKK